MSVNDIVLVQIPIQTKQENLICGDKYDLETQLPKIKNIKLFCFVSFCQFLLVSYGLTQTEMHAFSCYL